MSAPAALPTRAVALVIAQNFAKSLENAIPDIDRTVDLIQPHGYWRDLLAIQWDHRTLAGRDEIRAFLKKDDKLGSKESPALFNIQIEDTRDGISCVDLPGARVCIMALFGFETQIGRGRGAIRLTTSLDSKDEWRAYMLFTMLEELKGHEEPLAPLRRPNGTVHKPMKHRLTWLEQRQGELDFSDAEPEVVIVGAAQAGLSLAARLKMLNVRTLVLEKHQRVGDPWRKRFRHLTLHDPVHHNPMPFIPYPSFWPRYTPKDKLADFFEAYASMLELNVWTGSVLAGPPSYDDVKREWTVRIRRASGEERVVRPKFLIQATGVSGEPNVPTFEGQDVFKGAIMHSSQFIAGTTFKGKHAVVVGTGNSGHDIAQDFWESDAASVIMVQRGSTYVISIQGSDIYSGPYYKESVPGQPPCPSTEDCDLITQSVPLHVALQELKAGTQKAAELDQDLLAGLEQAGFKTDLGIDGAGFLSKYFRTGGGYYVDVGASGLIVNGEIKVKSRNGVSHFTRDAVVLTDGSELKADVVVLATGYTNMRVTTRKIFGDAVADRTRDVWGLDEEGEIRTIWRDSGHPGFFYMGGHIAQCRFMSKRLALRLKAKLLGLP